MGWFDSIGGFFSSVASAISSAVSSAFGGGGSGSSGSSGGSGGSSSSGSSGSSGSGGFGGVGSGGWGGGGLGLDGGLANAAAGGGYGGGSSGSGGSSSGSSSSSSSGSSGGGSGGSSSSGSSGGGGSGGGLGGDHSSGWGGISSGDHASLNLDGALHNAAHGGGYSYSATHHDNTPKRTPKPTSKSALDLDGALHNAAHGGLLEKATTQKQTKVKSTEPSLNLDGALHNAAHGGGYSYKPNKNIEVKAKPKIDINKPDTVFDTTLNLDEHAAKLNKMVSGQIGALKSFEDKLSSAKKTARQYEKTQYMLDPLTGAATGFIAGLGLGAAEFFGGLGALGEQAIVNPASLPSTLKDSIVGTGKQVIEAAKALPDTIPAGEVVGQVLAGAALEGGLEYAGVKTPGSILHDTISGPVGKLNTLFDPLRRGYKPELSEEINFVPAPTYEPRPVEHYIDRFAGKENTLIHMTSSSVFAKAREGDEILLKGNPEAATGFRRNYDLLHWYQSLPTDEGKPNAYLAYVGIGQRESEKAEFRLRPSRKVGIVTRDIVNYIPPKEGETLAEYSKRVGKLSGVTQIPAENVFDKSVERQVITPAAFEGNLDEYPGTKLKKISDIGWTRYQENRLPEELKNTKVGEFLEKIGIGQKYHKVEFSKWEKIPVEDTDFDEVKPVEGAEREVKHLNLEEYNEEYLTPKREVTLSDSISKATEELSLTRIKSSNELKELSPSSRKLSSSSKKSSGIMELSSSSGYGELIEGIKPSKHSSGRKTSSGTNSWWDRWNKWEKLWSSGGGSSDFPGSSNPPGKSPYKPSKGGESIYPSNAGSGGQSNYPSSPPAGNSASGSGGNPEKMVSVKYKPVGLQAKTGKRKIKGKLFDLKDWKLNPDITPLADWWAMTYTQAFLGLKARSPYRFDAKKRWKAELTDYGFGLTFPTKFLEERRVKTYLDVTIKKAGEIDIVTGKRAKKKVNRAKSLKLVGKDFVNVEFGSGKQADDIFNEKLKKLKI